MARKSITCQGISLRACMEALAQGCSVTDRAVPPLTLRLFGPFTLGVNGRPLPRLRSRKGQWLLVLLALRAGMAVERSWLAGTLWPESSGAQALNSLRVTLADLRQALGEAA